MAAIIALQAAPNQVHIGLLASESRNDRVGPRGRFCARRRAAALLPLLRRGRVLLLLLALPLLRALWLGLLPFAQILSATCASRQHTLKWQMSAAPA